MRITVNNNTNVRTCDGKGPWPENPRSAVDVTVPRFRACLSPMEARELGAQLLEAADRAETERARIEGEAVLRALGEGTVGAVSAKGEK